MYPRNQPQSTTPHFPDIMFNVYIALVGKLQLSLVTSNFVCANTEPGDISPYQFITKHCVLINIATSRISKKIKPALIMKMEVKTV